MSAGDKRASDSDDADVKRQRVARALAGSGGGAPAWHGSPPFSSFASPPPQQHHSAAYASLAMLRARNAQLAAALERERASHDDTLALLAAAHANYAAFVRAERDRDDNDDAASLLPPDMARQFARPASPEHRSVPPATQSAVRASQSAVRASQPASRALPPQQPQQEQPQQEQQQQPPPPQQQPQQSPDTGVDDDETEQQPLSPAANNRTNGGGGGIVTGSAPPLQQLQQQQQQHQLNLLKAVSRTPVNALPGALRVTPTPTLPRVTLTPPLPPGVRFPRIHFSSSASIATTTTAAAAAAGKTEVLPPPPLPPAAPPSLAPPDLSLPQGATLAERSVAIWPSLAVPSAGSGLFAARAFAEGELIARFSGQVMTRRDGQSFHAADAGGRLAFIDGRAILGTSAAHLQQTEGTGSIAVQVDNLELANATRVRLMVPRTDPSYGLWLRAIRPIAPGDEIVAFVKKQLRRGGGGGGGATADDDEGDSHNEATAEDV
jgi:hypothetical protein